MEYIILYRILLKLKKQMAVGIDSTSQWGSDIGTLWRQATTDIPEKEKKEATNSGHIVEE